MAVPDCTLLLFKGEPVPIVNTVISSSLFEKVDVFLSIVRFVKNLESFSGKKLINDRQINITKTRKENIYFVVDLIFEFSSSS